MTDIIKTVLSLIFDKARDVVSSELSEGDLTDEKFRKVIAREINEINKKLDALGRKDLLSSVQFLKEGLNRLGKAMQKKSMNSDEPTTSRNTELDTFTAVDGASTTQRRVNEAFTIPNVIAKKFEVVSLERLANAKESFKESRKEATRAFSNEALSIDDRIMATELRIVSRILESFLEDPEAGGSDCLLYLEELHSLPAVREMYSVYVGGGAKSYLKSFFNRKDREKVVKTIESINTAVRDFIAGFTTKVFCDGVNWPIIQLRNKNRTYTLSLISKENIEFSRMKARWPETNDRWKSYMFFPLYWLTKLKERTETNFLTSQAKTGLKRESKTCFLKLQAEPLKKDSTVCRNFDEFYDQNKNVLCFTTDASFLIYVLSYVCESPNSAPVFTIFVFDSNKKLSKRIKTDLSCGSNSPCIGFAMKVLESKIAVLREQFDCRRINFIDFSTGETYHTIFLPPLSQAFDSRVEPCINILNDSEIMVTRSDEKAVYIYTNERQLKQTIHLPLEVAFTICDIAYRAASEEVLVLTEVFQEQESSDKRLPNSQLLVYSTNGALQDSYDLYTEWYHDLLFVNDLKGRIMLINSITKQIIHL